MHTNCPYPELCQLLFPAGESHVRGAVLRLWNAPTGQRHREAWAARVGLDLAALLQRFPPTGETLPSLPPPAEKPAKPAAPSITDEELAAQRPCVYRGEQLRDAVCRPCQNEGRASIPVFDCELHIECVLRGTVPSPYTKSALPACLTCSERLATIPDGQRSVARHPLSKHVTRWAVGVTTAPRRTPTLQRTVRSLQAAGFEPVVYAEPGTDVSGLSTTIVQRPVRLGCWQNYVQSLRDLLETFPDAQAVAMFQDDVVVARDLRDFLEHELWPGPETGIVSLYTPGEREGNGWLRVMQRNGVLVGIQAVVYPVDAVRRLLASPFATSWRGTFAPVPTPPPPVKRRAIDTGVGLQMQALGLQTYYYVPSLAQHIGDVSTLGHGSTSATRGGVPYRRSSHFIGEHVSIWDKAPQWPWCRFNLPSGRQRFAAQPASPPANITIVVPGSNCIELTKRCLTAIASQHYPRLSEVIYVDDASTEATADAVEIFAGTLPYPMQILRNVKKQGYPSACNRGIAAASEKDHILLLGKDTAMGPTCLERLHWHAERHDRVASLGPITGDDGPQSLKHAGLRKLVGWQGSWESHRYAAATGSRLTIAVAEQRRMLSSFCWLLTRAGLDRFGPLSTDQAYTTGGGAAAAWCLQANNAGWFNLLVGNAWCVRSGG